MKNQNIQEEKINMLLSAGALEEVNELVSSLIKSDPDNAFLNNTLAHYHYHKKDYKTAAKFNTKVLTLYPDNVYALTFKAFIAQETGDEKTFIDTLQKLINTGDGNFEIYNNLATYSFENGDFLKALSLYTRALREADNLNPLHAATGAANCYSRGGASEIADEIYDSLLEIVPGDNMILYNKAVNSSHKGDFKEAENCISKIPSTNVTDAGLKKKIDELHKEISINLNKQK